MTDRELMQQALDAMEAAIKSGDWKVDGACDPDWVLNALRARLAQPEQEPVAWWHDMGDVVDLNVSGRGIPLYTAPPQREWQGLTDEEIMNLIHDVRWQNMVVTTHYLARAIEAKLKQKNE